MSERLPMTPGPIGIFDSGYGGLTILHGIRQLLPQYDYVFLGDNHPVPLLVGLGCIIGSFFIFS